MISLKRKESGFTIVELLIVIVVIGILAALVVTTFSGIQKKARDSERQTDIGALHSQLEAYHAQPQNGRYPTNTNLDLDSFVTTNMKGLDLTALADPKAAGGSNDLAGAPAANVYSYVETPTGCDNSTTDCTGYTLTATLESGGTYVKTSLN